MTWLFLIVIAVIALAVLFDFVNGFHDASNVVATMIASRSMSPEFALIMAATAEFVGPFLFGTAVAKTIGKEIVDPRIIDVWLVAGALIGAIFWNLLTWKLGLPSSSSHALIGGIAGSALAASGIDHIKLAGFGKIVLVLITSPVIGFLCGWFLQKTSVFAARGATPRASEVFKRLQLPASVALALSHGANDAQKSMGVITMVLIAYAGLHPEAVSPATDGLGRFFQFIPAATVESFAVPGWTIFVCALAMGLGTAFGGWSIIKTVGSGIYRLRPIHGFSAQASATTVIMIASRLGFPVSTTHVVSSGIMGVGSAERFKAVRWHKAKEIISTWFLTIPAAGTVSALTYLGMKLMRDIF